MKRLHHDELFLYAALGLPAPSGTVEPQGYDPYNSLETRVPGGQQDVEPLRKQAG